MTKQTKIIVVIVIAIIIAIVIYYVMNNKPGEKTSIKSTSGLSGLLGSGGLGSLFGGGTKKPKTESPQTSYELPKNWDDSSDETSAGWFSFNDAE